MSWANCGAQTMTLSPGSPSSRDVANPSKMLSLARAECHFSVHKLFLGSDNFVLDNVYKLAGIHTHIVRGRYDAICVSVPLGIYISPCLKANFTL